MTVQLMVGKAKLRLVVSSAVKSGSILSEAYKAISSTCTRGLLGEDDASRPSGTTIHPHTSFRGLARFDPPAVR
jgi:hypothetical protein